MTSANPNATPGAWFVDGDIFVIGYHQYQPGKTVRAVDYFRNNPNTDYTSGLSLDPTILAQVERFYGDVEINITPRRGLLIGSTAIAAIPGSTAFIRAHARVNSGRYDIDIEESGAVVVQRVDSDLGRGSKAFGRQIATNRLLKALEGIIQTVTLKPGTVATADQIRAQLSSHKDLYERIIESSLIEVVDESELTTNERSLLRLPKTVNA